VREISPLMPRELRVHSVPTWSENLRTGVEIVAIVAAGIWALYTFVYEQRIKPLGEAPSFSVPTSVEQGPTVHGVVFLTIHKRIQNTGNVSIDLAAESLSVYGERIEEHAAPRARIETPSRAVVAADAPRRPVKLLYSTAKLRAGAAGGSNTDFVVPPHSDGDEEFLVAVPAGAYPVVLITRKDYVIKTSSAGKIAVKIVSGTLGGYDLQSTVLQGEYDSRSEFPIRP
jgi:hypothetical protein